MNDITFDSGILNAILSVLVISLDALLLFVGFAFLFGTFGLL